MWQMFINSLKLFLRGRLFRDPRAVLRQWLIGVAICLAVVIVLGLVGAPVPATVAIAAFASGLLQPYLFKDLKYH